MKNKFVVCVLQNGKLVALPPQLDAIVRVNIPNVSLNDTSSLSCECSETVQPYGLPFYENLQAWIKQSERIFITHQIFHKSDLVIATTYTVVPQDLSVSSVSVEDRETEPMEYSFSCAVASTARLDVKSPMPWEHAETTGIVTETPKTAETETARVEEKQA